MSKDKATRRRMTFADACKVTGYDPNWKDHSVITIQRGIVAKVTGFVRSSLAELFSIGTAVKPNFKVVKYHGDKKPRRIPANPLPSYPDYVSDGDYYDREDPLLRSYRDQRWFPYCRKCAWHMSNHYTVRTVKGIGFTKVITLSSRKKYEVNPDDSREYLISDHGFTLKRRLHKGGCKLGVGFREWMYRYRHVGADELESGVLRQYPSVEFDAKRSVAPWGVAHIDDSPDCKLCSDLGCTSRLSAPEDLDGNVDQDFEPMVTEEDWTCPRGYCRRDYLYRLPAEPDGMYYMSRGGAVCDEYVNVKPFLYRLKWRERLNIKRAVHYLRWVRVNKKPEVAKYYASNLLWNVRKKMITNLSKQKMHVVCKGGEYVVTYTSAYLSLMDELRKYGLLKKAPKLRKDLVIHPDDAKLLNDGLVDIIYDNVKVEASDYDGRPAWQRIADMILKGEIKSRKKAKRWQQKQIDKCLKAKHAVDSWSSCSNFKDPEKAARMLNRSPRVYTKWGFWNALVRSIVSVKRGSSAPDKMGK